MVCHIAIEVSVCTISAFHFLFRSHAVFHGRHLTLRVINEVRDLGRKHGCHHLGSHRISEVKDFGGKHGRRHLGMWGKGGSQMTTSFDAKTTKYGGDSPTFSLLRY